MQSALFGLAKSGNGKISLRGQAFNLLGGGGFRIGMPEFFFNPLILNEFFFLKYELAGYCFLPPTFCMNLCVCVCVCVWMGLEK